MKSMLKVPLAWFITCQMVFAWNSNGHVLISSLAYDRMKPQTQKWLNHMLSPDFDLASASVWLDQVHDKSLSKIHYINLPYGDERFFQKSDTANALTAIQQAKQVLSDKNSSLTEKQLAIRILLHVIADVHQPMHTINYYSRKFPHGDKGGNLWRIKYHGNLHHYWDSGAGYLDGFSRFDLKCLTYKKQRIYCASHLSFDAELDPQQWVAQSHQLARQFAYFPPKNPKKWFQYHLKAQDISKQQILKAAIDMAASFDELVKSQVSQQ